MHKKATLATPCYDIVYSPSFHGTLANWTRWYIRSERDGNSYTSSTNFIMPSSMFSDFDSQALVEAELGDMTSFAENVHFLKAWNCDCASRLPRPHTRDNIVASPVYSFTLFDAKSTKWRCCSMSVSIQSCVVVARISDGGTSCSVYSMFGCRYQVFRKTPHTQLNQS